MRKILLIQILALITLNSFGQIKQIDLDVIKSIAATDTYSKLFARFLTNDTTLSLDDYRIIYYGQVFQDSYKPSARHDSVRALNYYLNSYDSIDFNRVLNYTQLILNDFPFNIEQIFLTAVAFDKLGEHELSKLWFYKYDNYVVR